MMFIVGDYNAKVKKDEDQTNTARQYLLHKNSDNGNILVEFDMSNNVFIKTTLFPHKKYIWTYGKCPQL